MHRFVKQESYCAGAACAGADARRPRLNDALRFQLAHAASKPKDKRLLSLSRLLFDVWVVHTCASFLVLVVCFFQSHWFFLLTRTRQAGTHSPSPSPGLACLAVSPRHGTR